MHLTPFTPLEVATFFQHHRWMAVYAPQRAETLWNASGGKGYAECVRVTAEWMRAVEKHEPAAFTAIMHLQAPDGFAALEDVFHSWSRHRLGKFVETVENRVTLERFGFRIRTTGWPWRWRSLLSESEMRDVIDRLHEGANLLFHPSEAEHWQAAYLMAASVYPERFSLKRRTDASTRMFTGLHFRARGFTEKGQYSIWLVLEGRGGSEAVLDLPDDALFAEKVRGFLTEAIKDLSALEAWRPISLTIVDPSERQKEILRETLGGLLPDPKIRFIILTPVTPATGGEPRRRVRIWDGKRYLVSTE